MKRIIQLIFCLFFISITEARVTYNFNSDWVIDYTLLPDSVKQRNYDGKKTVTLPHAWNENDAYRMPITQMTTGKVWYRKTFRLPASAQDKHVFIEFEGARQSCKVLLNGILLGHYDNGVMAFGFELTSYLMKGENILEVLTDNSWKAREHGTESSYQWNDRNFNANYGGLPKNVWLHVMDDVYQTLPLWGNLQTTGTYI
jgi:beta-galactosidase/beta-glucuronidase